MRRIIIYIIVLTLSLLVPEQGTDAGKLIPVELIYIYKAESSIVLETDTGNWGRGNTVDEAIENLKETAAGEIFLDTAEYLLVDDTCVDHLDDMSSHLKGTVKVCMAENALDLQEAAEYLKTHKPKTRLKAWKTQGIGEKIKEIEGRILLT